MVKFNDADFRSTIGRITGATGRSIAESLNRFAYYSARGAARNTVRVSKATIASELGQIVTVKTGTFTKRGRERTRRVATLAAARDYPAPLAAILVNIREKKAGRPGLYGAEMHRAVEKFIAFRQKSRAFLASGWLPAIKHFAKLVKDRAGAPQVSGEIRQLGKPKGGGREARTQALTAIIWNAAGAESAHGQAAMSRYTEPALAQALAEELQSSKTFLENLLRKAWRGTGAKVR